MLSAPNAPRKPTSRRDSTTSHFSVSPTRNTGSAYCNQLEPAQADRCSLLESVPVARRASRPGDIVKRAGQDKNRDSWLIRTPRDRRKVTAKERERANCRLTQILFRDRQPPFPSPLRGPVSKDSPPRDDFAATASIREPISFSRSVFTHKA